VSPNRATDPYGSGTVHPPTPESSRVPLAAASHRRSGVFECFSELLHGAIVLICGQRMTTSEDEGNRPFQHAKDAKRPDRGVIG